MKLFVSIVFGSVLYVAILDCYAYCLHQQGLRSTAATRRKPGESLFDFARRHCLGSLQTRAASVTERFTSIFCSPLVLCSAIDILPTSCPPSTFPNTFFRPLSSSVFSSNRPLLEIIRDLNASPVSRGLPLFRNEERNEKT